MGHLRHLKCHSHQLKCCLCQYILEIPEHSRLLSITFIALCKNLENLEKTSDPERTKHMAVPCFFPAEGHFRFGAAVSMSFH